MDLRTKPEGHSPKLVFLLAALSVMNAMGVEITLPAIVPVARDFNVPEQSGGQLIGYYFLAYAFGQMLWGLLSDAFGRRPMILLGMIGFILASIGAAFAPTFDWLLAFRIMQGVCLSAPIVASAVIRDLATGNTAARTFAILTAAVAMAPVASPAIGSVLLTYFSWRAIFIFLGVFSAGLWLATFFFLPETLAQKQVSRLKPSFILNRSRELLGSRQYVAGALLMSLSFSGYATILTLGTVIAESNFGISPINFGYIYGISALAILSGSLLARRLLKTRSMPQVAWVALGFVSLSLATHLSFFWFPPSFNVFWGGIMIYMLGFGMIHPTATSYALEAAKSASGFGASLIGAITMGTAFSSSFISAAFYDGTFRTISATMIIFGSLALASFAIHRWKLH